MSRKRPSGRAPARKPAAKRRPRRRPHAFISFLKWSYIGIVNAPVEVWGLVVMFGAVLGGLGVYTGGAGPLGRGLDYLTRLFVGDVAVALPPVLFAGGAMLLVPVLRLHIGRIMAGSALGLFAATGMVHLAVGNKPIYASLEKLSNIGGIFGAMAANPVSGLIGVWATWMLLGVLLVASLLIVTKTPISRVVHWVRLALSHAVAFLRGLIAGHGDEDDSDDYYDDEIPDEDIYIEDDEEVLAPASRPRKGTKARDDGERPPTSLDAGRPTQMALVVGDSSNYKLPGLDLLAKGGDREVSTRHRRNERDPRGDARAVQGRRLRHRLHCRPDRDSLRDRAGRGRQGQPRALPLQRDQVRAGIGRAALPGPHPRALGDRDRGPEPQPASS